MQQEQPVIISRGLRYLFLRLLADEVIAAADANAISLLSYGSLRVIFNLPARVCCFDEGGKLVTTIVFYDLYVTHFLM